jgi:shikimate dehydrogenase
MNLYGLIGYRLGHSFSKKYFNTKFETEGLAGCFFELFPIEKIEDLPSLLKNNSDLKGLAVTIPYKQSVMQYLHTISEEAKKIGAVNCIEFLPEGLKGHNTDVIGFERSFAPLLKPTHQKALVLGSGGSSKAVQYVLQKLKISFLVVSRNAAGEGMISYDAIDKSVLDEYTVIINCSPVGMSPHDDEKPALPYQFINSRHYFYDLVYQPAETMFLKEGKEKGAVVKNGYDMLVLQAEENWEIWKGATSY